MSAAQRFFKAILPPAAFAAMEAESRTWRMKCVHCDNQFSVWDIGGIRFKAAGTPKRYAACPACGRRAWTVLSRTSVS
jgi:hypothetical protein